MIYLAVFTYCIHDVLYCICVMLYSLFSVVHVAYNDVLLYFFIFTQYTCDFFDVFTHVHVIYMLYSVKYLVIF